MRQSALLLAALCTVPAAYAANPTEGRVVFTELCADCHSMSPGKNKRGPSLAGVVGRKAGLATNYHYSSALGKSGIVWTPARLAQYLNSPKTDLPGTKMRLLKTPSPNEVADLLAWLQQTP
jgi:cytochrome c